MRSRSNSFRVTCVSGLHRTIRPLEIELPAAGVVMFAVLLCGAKEAANCLIHSRQTVEGRQPMRTSGLHTSLRVLRSYDDLKSLKPCTVPRTMADPGSVGNIGWQGDDGRKVSQSHFSRSISSHSFVASHLWSSARSFQPATQLRWLLGKTPCRDVRGVVDEK